VGGTKVEEIGMLGAGGDRFVTEIIGVVAAAAVAGVLRRDRRVGVGGTLEATLRILSVAPMTGGIRGRAIEKRAAWKAPCPACGIGGAL
jgi:hypothetical protein